METKATRGVFKHAAFASRPAHRSLLFGSCLDLLIKFTNETYNTIPPWATTQALELYLKNSVDQIPSRRAKIGVQNTSRNKENTLSKTASLYLYRV